MIPLARAISKTLGGVHVRNVQVRWNRDPLLGSYANVFVLELLCLT